MPTLSKYLQACLSIIQSRKVTPFQPKDFHPTFTDPDEVFSKLVKAGKLSQFYVGQDAFYQLKTPKKP